MPKKNPTPIISEQSQKDFENLGNLVSIIVDAESRINELTAELEEVQRAWIDDHRKEVTELQGALLAAKQGAEELCKRHRAWFGGKQSMELLHGTCQFKKSKGLAVANELVSIALLEGSGKFDFIRTEKSLDLEKLEKLDDASLVKVGIVRTSREGFNVVARKVDLAKAAAAEPEKKAA